MKKENSIGDISTHVNIKENIFKIVFSDKNAFFNFFILYMDLYKEANTKDLINSKVNMQSKLFFYRFLQSFKEYIEEKSKEKINIKENENQRIYEKDGNGSGNIIINDNELVIEFSNKEIMNDFIASYYKLLHYHLIRIKQGKDYKNYPKYNYIDEVNQIYFMKFLEQHISEKNKQIKDEK
ncbi:hypothetical protein [Campylobacter ureolyticus]|uniref:hypothetical protein n=2 Tax=Campylobacter ureolyticus TaxID=827 RepID=UPI0004689B3F|nr:hypothetical protein [Campylobacter ureolyticus]